MAKKKSNRSVATGTLKKHRKGFGFVILPEDSPYSELGDIFISPGSMHGAMVSAELNVAGQLRELADHHWIKGLPSKHTATVRMQCIVYPSN